MKNTRIHIALYSQLLLVQTSEVLGSQLSDDLGCPLNTSSLYTDNKSGIEISSPERHTRGLDDPRGPLNDCMPEEGSAVLLRETSHDAETLSSKSSNCSVFEHPDDTTLQITAILNRHEEFRDPLLTILKRYERAEEDSSPLNTSCLESGLWRQKKAFERHVASVVLGSIPHGIAPERLTIRILSMDGGGVRGIVPAYFLKRLEERFQCPIQKMFHFVAGSSAGGILATALSLPSDDQPTKPRFTAKELETLLFKETGNIFTKNWWSFFGLFGSQYKDPIKVFQRLAGKDTLFSNGVMRAMVTSYDLEANALKLLTNFPTTECKLEHRGPEAFTAADVMRATSAAPTYFPPHMCQPRANGLTDRYVLGDGGIGANNPSRIILQEVLSQYPGAEILMVSLGTGYKARNLSYKDVHNAGSLKWLRIGLIDMLMSVPNALGVHEVETLFNPRPQANGHMQSMINGMYFRFDPSVTDDSMDNVKESNLRALTQDMQRDIDKPGSMWSHLIQTLEQRPMKQLPR